MIVIEYVELTQDAALGVLDSTVLGTETHDRIDEVLLPGIPSRFDPIFMTKKFTGMTEHRWAVVDVRLDRSRPAQTYVVSLSRREQVAKEHYLRNILKLAKKPAKSVLYKNAIVEVEYGHPMDVCDIEGKASDNRRYVDTVQKGSMPKRRLAIVNQVIDGLSEELIQVIPISSKAPLTPRAQQRNVDVTSCLTNLVNYRKQSWAVCDMMETVSRRRIMAPLRRAPLKGRRPASESRDVQFQVKIAAPIRAQINEAMLHSMDQYFRVKAEEVVKEKLAAATEKISALTEDLEAIARSLDTTVAELRVLAGLAPGAV